MKLLNFDEFNLNENTNVPLVKKGQKVKVTLTYLESAPVADMEAKDDSSYNDYMQTETFSFLFGGDMMMFAQWDGEKWISK